MVYVRLPKNLMPSERGHVAPAPEGSGCCCCTQHTPASKFGAGIKGLRIRVQGVAFRVQGAGCRVEG